MFIIMPIENFFRAEDSVVNWINCHKRCVEPLEIEFKRYYPKNYLEYITDPVNSTFFNTKDDPIGGVLYNETDIVLYNKYIFNVYLYKYPTESIGTERIEQTFHTLIQCLKNLKVSRISIPIFNSYNPTLPSSEIKEIIASMFSTHASDIHVTVYA